MRCALVRVDHAVALGALEEARGILDEWEMSQTGEAATASTLQYYRDLVGQPEHALAAARRVADAMRDKPWEHLSALLSVARLATGTGQYVMALDALQDSAAILARHKDWYRLGIARQTVELACDLAAIAIQRPPVAIAYWLAPW
jgi:hypothetical protein